MGREITPWQQSRLADTLKGGGDGHGVLLSAAATMTLAEATDTTRIYSVAGRTGGRTAVVTTRPCRAPHQTMSAVGLTGGGQVPRPGEGSRAHHGVLFLNAPPEFRRHVLEVLRQPLGMVKHQWAFTHARACRFRLTLLRGYGPMDTSVAWLGHGYIPMHGFWR
jgi:hypothetical protein